MPPERVSALFREFRARWLAGDWPDAAEYLARAGEEADDLALMLELLLAQPVPEPAPEEARAYVEALTRGESPLLELRRRRGLRRQAVEEFLVERFRIDPARRPKLKQRYHELESGLLAPERLSARLLEGLSELFGARVRDLVTWRAPELGAEPAYFRAPATPPLEGAASPLRAEAEDEVDRLFFGGAPPRRRDRSHPGSFEPAPIGVQPARLRWLAP